MGWKGVLISLLYLATLGESKSRSAQFWPVSLSTMSSSLYSWAVCSAAIFVVVALVLSMYLIFEHLAAYNQPEEQKFLIGLILMVPVYALESFLSLLHSDAAFNCEIIRDCYEAFALYCFERYLIACLGGEESTIQFMESQSLFISSVPLLDEAYTYGVVEHPFPLNCFLRDWQLGSDFYQAVKIGIVQYMGVAAVLHLYIFSAVPYKLGERCVRNVAVMTDYASLGTPPDPEEVRDCERSTMVRTARHDEIEERMKLHQCVRDVVIGSGEIIVGDMKFTVSHVVQPVERGIAKINRTFHEISENVKRKEECKKNYKDDSYLVPLNSWRKEFSDVHDDLIEGSTSDSGLSEGKRPHFQSKGTSSRSTYR